ncbi:hypothetical protein EW026_g1101 [Hermanssonia centrifuga]|uniref:Uncharacterized protein n=1 Tax=Hermanssonia centrifuga TaxID=98765 RepID=A0A4S4KSR4_9APHY|nr:hypothetical protein EW026_g1101 [Hermanssonia centrifuga]
MGDLVVSLRILGRNYIIDYSRSLIKMPGQPANSRLAGSPILWSLTYRSPYVWQYGQANSIVNCTSCYLPSSG